MPPNPPTRLARLEQSQIELLREALVELKVRAQDEVGYLTDPLRKKLLDKIDDVYNAASSVLHERALIPDEADSAPLRRRLHIKSAEFLDLEKQAGINFDKLLQICFAMRELVTTNDADFLSTETDPKAIADHFFDETAPLAAKRRAERQGHGTGH
jgi:hypothetical protein